MEWTSRDKRHKLLCGDVREMLRTLPEGSVHCCVTSPPYWGLRDYGTGQWEGGDAECDHVAEKTVRKEFHQTRATGRGYSKTTIHVSEIPQGDCMKCGAKRIDRQIGQESTPDEFVATMVDVFREVRRVLHDSGTVWLNLGTSYAGSWGNYAPGGINGTQRQQTDSGERWKRPAYEDTTHLPPTANVAGWKPKDLILIPFLVAEALRQDGWWLRSVICWAKKAPMPESVTDRPTNSWEPIFLLAKRARYFYDAEAVKESATYPNGMNGKDPVKSPYGQGFSAGRSNGATNGTRNLRNVWHLGPEPFPLAHFATFPSEIPRRAILAGTSHEGCCPQCVEPWRRVVEKTPEYAAISGKSVHDHKGDGVEYGMRQGGKGPLSGTETSKQCPSGLYRTIGFEPGCDCNAGHPVPCTVLDPFAGSGTVSMVAAQLARRSVGVELNPEYWQMAIDSVDAELQQPLLF